MGKWGKAPFLAQYAYEGDGQGRTYLNPFTGEKLPSVTTVLKNTPKADMNRWFARKVAERARDRVDIVLGDPDLVVDRLINAPNDFRDERAEIGTGVHQYVQAEFNDSWELPELDDEQWSMVRAWDRFKADYRVEILMSEFTVFGDGYAGTADLLLKYWDAFDGAWKISLTDIKTSKSIHDDHRWQLSALASGHTLASRTIEGSPGAVKVKKRGELPDSWWLALPVPQFDAVHVLQLRDGFYVFEEVENLDLNFGVFKCYRDLWYSLGALREAQK